MNRWCANKHPLRVERGCGAQKP